MTSTRTNPSTIFLSTEQSFIAGLSKSELDLWASLRLEIYRIRLSESVLPHHKDDLILSFFSLAKRLCSDLLNRRILFLKLGRLPSSVESIGFFQENRSKFYRDEDLLSGQSIKMRLREIRLLVNFQSVIEVVKKIFLLFKLEKKIKEVFGIEGNIIYHSLYFIFYHIGTKYWALNHFNFELKRIFFENNFRISGVIEACRVMEIEATEVMHGIVTDALVSVCFPTQLITQPHSMIVFSSGFKEMLEKTFPGHIEVRTPSVEYLKLIYDSRSEVNERKETITSRPILVVCNHYNFQELFDFCVKNSEDSDLKFIFRFHRGGSIYQQRKAVESQGFKVSYFDEPLFDVLIKCDGAISTYSSVLLEAAEIGIWAGVVDGSDTFMWGSLLSKLNILRDLSYHDFPPRFEVEGLWIDRD